MLNNIFFLTTNYLEITSKISTYFNRENNMNMIKKSVLTQLYDQRHCKKVISIIIFVF